MPHLVTTRRAYDGALVLATVAVLCATALLALRGRDAAPFTRDGESGYRAAIFLQEGDCTSNLAFLQLLARPEIAETLPVIVYDVGNRQNEERLATRLRAQDLPFRSRKAPRGSLNALRHMGYHTTPVLVLLGPGDRVRMAAAAPRTREEMRALDAVLRVFAALPAVSQW